MVRPWKHLLHEQVTQNPWWSTMRARFEMPDGKTGDYYYVAQSPCVNVFVQEPSGLFVLLREYRFVPDRISLSHVQGGVEEGETVEDAARREMEAEVDAAILSGEIWDSQVVATWYFVKQYLSTHG